MNFLTIRIFRILMQNKSLINRALTKQFIIPEFKEFRSEIGSLYEKCKDNKEGKVCKIDKN